MSTSGVRTFSLSYLLGTHLTIAESAAPAATLDVLAVVAGLAVVLVVPSLIWLLLLTRRGELTDEDLDTRHPAHHR